MKLRLVGLQVLLAIFTVIIIIITITAVVPALTGDIDVDIPTDDEIEWDIKENHLYVRGDMWVNNSGYYRMENIKIDVDVLGFNRTIFDDSISLAAVESGENKLIELELKASLDDFSDNELEELVFGEEESDDSIQIRIISDMSANYPFRILGFDLDYESVYEWEGLIKTFEYDEDEIQLSKSEDDTIISLPYEVETSDHISGSSIIDLYLYDGGHKEYSQTQLNIPLGERVSDDIDFIIDDELVEEFVFDDKEMILSSKVRFTELDLEFDHEERYSWTAPVRELNIKFEDADVSYSGDESEIIVPYFVHTTDDLTGNAIVEITMWNEDKNEMYSSTQEEIPLGTSFNDVMIYQLDIDDTQEFIINSQTLIFDLDITLQDKGIQFYTDETHEWGAPLNDFEIQDIVYDPIKKEVEGSFSFSNDSPRDLALDFEVEIYDVEDKVLADLFESYVVEPDETISDTITVEEIDEEPSYAIITFTDDNTGMVYEKEVEIY